MGRSALRPAWAYSLSGWSLHLPPCGGLAQDYLNNETSPEFTEFFEIGCPIKPLTIQRQLLILGLATHGKHLLWFLSSHSKKVGFRRDRIPVLPFGWGICKILHAPNERNKGLDYIIKMRRIIVLIVLGALACY